jgi:hypothetical protein
MRYAAKADANQGEIVQVLRQVGALVFHTHQVGGGFPDVVVLFRGAVHLVEVKTPGGKLTKAEQEWHDKWGDCEYVHIVRSAEDALEAIGAKVT